LLLNVSIEHRLMHAKRWVYMLYRLAYDRKIAPPSTPRLALVPDVLMMMFRQVLRWGLRRKGETFAG
jgi:hypothetical protein